MTEAGEAVLRRARRALAEVEAIAPDLDALRGLRTGRVLVGAIQSLGPFDLPGLLAAFRAQHPGIDVAHAPRVEPQVGPDRVAARAAVE